MQDHSRDAPIWKHAAAIQKPLTVDKATIASFKIKLCAGKTNLTTAQNLVHEMIYYR